MTEATGVALLLTITGRVQGVGYRDWAVAEARRLGLAGWVRNRRDGAVEALVAGEVAAVEAFVVACRQGPPFAQVVGAATAPAPSEDALTPFARRPTA
jgi:acylphosphatase